VNLGRTPLHFAVCTGQGPVVQALLRQCGDSKQRHYLLWKRDSLGNTIFHMCISHNMKAMYDILMTCTEDLERELQNSEWWHIKPRLSLEDDDNLKNYDGYTVSCLHVHKL
jgi:ankyrin repeat protein